MEVSTGLPLLKGHVEMTEDVRSLSLPGTYHEKITSLGTGLRNFSRLKHLDLSRNAIDSLQGLENLKLLEKLNLYYNNIGGLQELYRLRQNQKLQDLDLRLNPVARNEPDYRLFLIHMLPSLRRLDDRAVRDSERKAALMHFSTEQAATIGEPPRRPSPNTEKQPNPRVEHVKSMAKPVTVLDDDDANLLDLIARSGGELTHPVTGSSSSGPVVQDYPPESVRKMNVAGIGLTDRGPTSTYGIDPPLVPSTDNLGSTELGTQKEATGRTYVPSIDCLYERYPNIPMIIATPPSPQHKTGTVKPGHDTATRKNRVQFADDPNLEFQDELDAYTSYKAHGQFTPKPGSGVSTGKSTNMAPLSGPHHQGSAVNRDGVKPETKEDYNNTGVEFYSKPPSGSNKNESAVYQELPSAHSSVAPSSITAASSAFHAGNTMLSQDGINDSISQPSDPLLTRISDLVDRYWNGAKSLQNNQKFKELFNKALKDNLGPSITREMDNEKRLNQLEEEVTCLRAENMALRQQTTMAGDIDQLEDGKIKSSLIRAQRDLSILRSRLQMSMDENRNLQDRVAQLEISPTTNGLHEDLDQPGELERLRRENENLRLEISTLSTRMKQSTQLQELATMLQDSHKSLVQTNEHLLRELEETRSRHDQEVRQLHWSYDQLKKSVGYTPTVGSGSSVLNGKAAF